MLLIVAAAKQENRSPSTARRRDHPAGVLQPAPGRASSAPGVDVLLDPAEQ